MFVNTVIEKAYFIIDLIFDILQLVFWKSIEGNVASIENVCLRNVYITSRNVGLRLLTITDEEIKCSGRGLRGNEISTHNHRSISTINVLTSSQLLFYLMAIARWNRSWKLASWKYSATEENVKMKLETRQKWKRDSALKCRKCRHRGEMISSKWRENERNNQHHYIDISSAPAMIIRLYFLKMSLKINGIISNQAHASKWRRLRGVMCRWHL